MARQDYSQFHKYYTDGSAARQIEFKPRKPLPEQPKRPKQKKILIKVDFLALAGVVVASILLLMMISGVQNLMETSRQVAKLESYVTQLEEENARMEVSYHSSYNPAEIRERAAQMGLVPAEQVKTVEIPLTEPENAAETETVISRVLTFFRGLFA